jgi:hypothetical protein
VGQGVHVRAQDRRLPAGRPPSAHRRGRRGVDQGGAPRRDFRHRAPGGRGRGRSGRHPPRGGQSRPDWLLVRRAVPPAGLLRGGGGRNRPLRLRGAGPQGHLCLAERPPADRRARRIRSTLPDGTPSSNLPANPGGCDEPGAVSPTAGAGSASRRTRRAAPSCACASSAARRRAGARTPRQRRARRRSRGSAGRPRGRDLPSA